MVNIGNLFINQDNSGIGINKDFSPIEAGIYIEGVKITTAEEWNKAIENFNKRANEYIPKEKIREKIKELKNKIKSNKQELDKNPDPMNSKFYSFDDYFKWKNKKLKENELIKYSIQVLQEFLGE